MGPAWATGAAGDGVGGGPKGIDGPGAGAGVLGGGATGAAVPAVGPEAAGVWAGAGGMSSTGGGVGDGAIGPELSEVAGCVGRMGVWGALAVASAIALWNSVSCCCGVAGAVLVVLGTLGVDVEGVEGVDSGLEGTPTLGADGPPGVAGALGVPGTRGTPRAAGPGIDGGAPEGGSSKYIGKDGFLTVSLSPEAGTVGAGGGESEKSAGPSTDGILLVSLAPDPREFGAAGRGAGASGAGARLTSSPKDMLLARTTRLLSAIGSSRVSCPSLMWSLAAASPVPSTGFPEIRDPAISTTSTFSLRVASMMA